MQRCHELWCGWRTWLRPGMLLWLWLWHRPAAVALIGPPAWEPPYYAVGVARKIKKKSEWPVIGVKSDIICDKK